MANIFNAAQYLELYPAIAEYGYNEANAWDHFVQYGAAELRTPNDELKGKVYAESVLNYANGNPELAEYFGVVVPAESLTAAQQGELLLHYVMYGNAEERENKIIDAPVQGEDSDLSDLRDALETVVAADADIKEAVEAAVEGLELDDVADSPLAAQETAVKGEYTEAANIIQNGTVDGRGDVGALAIPEFAGVEDAAVRTQLIEAKQAQLAVVEQQTGKALGANKAKVDAYLAAEARVEGLFERLLTADENAHNAGVLAGAALTVANDNTYSVVYAQLAEEVSVEGAIEDANNNEFVITEKNGEVDVAAVTLVINPNTNQVSFLPAEPNEAEAALIKAVKASPNYSSLTQSLQQVNALEKQLGTAWENLQTAQENVPANGDDDENDGPFSDAAQAYIDAKNNVKDFADNVADFREVEAYQNAIEAANAAKKAAVEALEELGYEINTDNFGTPEDDLFVYDSNEKTTTVFAFGEEGEDLFFFGDYSFEELKPNDNFEKGSFGDRNVLEIFAQQKGTDVVLYVETNEVGGNALGLDNVNTITLVGVNLEDLSFDSGAGFLVG